MILAVTITTEPAFPAARAKTPPSTAACTAFKHLKRDSRDGKGAEKKCTFCPLHRQSGFAVYVKLISQFQP